MSSGCSKEGEMRDLNSGVEPKSALTVVDSNVVLLVSVKQDKCELTKSCK